jgi:hypothetical protein
MKMIPVKAAKVKAIKATITAKATIMAKETLRKAEKEKKELRNYECNGE